MSIRVTCPGCHTRFNVSEKFSGREGPCPKCKKIIKIPKSSEDVKVHVPENFGPKSVAGEAVLKPVFRQETKLSPVQIVLIFSFIIGIAVIALMLRVGVANKDSFSPLILTGLSILVAAPCVFAGYTFLRDSELASLSGQDLWIRVGICALVYGLSWLSFYVANLAMDDDFGTTTRIFGMAAMFVIGALAANLLLGLDFTLCILHFGLFFGCCLILRAIIGLTLLPGSLETVVDENTARLLIHFDWTAQLSHFVS